MVEFALGSVVLLLFLTGIMDLGLLFAGRITCWNATRAAARWAATHPTAWDSSPSPAPSSIEGKLKVGALPTTVPNDDAHIQINYYLTGLGAPTLCGSYSAATSSFVAQGAYTQQTCVAPGSLVQVKVTYQYSFLTPLLARLLPTATIKTDAVELEEV